MIELVASIGRLHVGNSQAITRLSPTGLQEVWDMLKRDDFGSRKLANQRLIVGSDCQASR